MPIKIVIGENHPLFRAGLNAMLCGIMDISDVLDVGDFGGVLSALNDYSSVSLVALNIALPGMGGLSGVRQLCALRPNLAVVLLTAGLERDRVLEALNIGVHGVIPLTLPVNEMASAFQNVLRGQMYVPVLNTHGMDGAPLRSVTHGGVSGEHPLTLRQREVLSLLAAGKSNKEIGRQLAIAEGTVKIHVTAAFRSLGVSNRVSAAAAFTKLGPVARQQLPLPGIFEQRRRSDDVPAPTPAMQRSARG